MKIALSLSYSILTFFLAQSKGTIRASPKNVSECAFLYDKSNSQTMLLISLVKKLELDQEIRETKKVDNNDFLF